MQISHVSNSVVTRRGISLISLFLHSYMQQWCFNWFPQCANYIVLQQYVKALTSLHIGKLSTTNSNYYYTHNQYQFNPPMFIPYLLEDVCTESSTDHVMIYSIKKSHSALIMAWMHITTTEKNRGRAWLIHHRTLASRGEFQYVSLYNVLTAILIS